MKNESKLPKRTEELMARVREIRSLLPKPSETAPKTRDSIWNWLGDGEMSGGCILFGGWLKITPDNGSKYAYCAFGGIGIGGWVTRCHIYSIYSNLGELYAQATRCMIVSGHGLPDEPDTGGSTDCLLFNSHSDIVGIVGTEAGNCAFVGGSVSWKNK